ncbi:YlbF family regulator [Streptococcus phocae subsp. salmonis]|uniref:YlbF family regulator n=1 Tax=Streptococcus phocae TaxID=119224 RepID=UPI000531EC42|nr:YlbF family regulator [Streptococcus phocae]KGR72375.1 hypothetical protein NX86_06555 [Streptococcus phocae subsp. salmonis]
MLVIDENLMGIEELIDHLIEDLKRTSQYQSYITAKCAFEKDEILQKQLVTFQALVEEHEAMKECLGCRPEGKALRQEFLRQKKQIDLHPLVIDLRLAQVDLQTILADITQEIASAVSQDIFVDTDLPLAAKKAPHPSGPYQNIKEKRV